MPSEFSISGLKPWKVISRDFSQKTAHDYKQALQGKARAIGWESSCLMIAAEMNGGFLAGGDKYNLFVFSGRDLGFYQKVTAKEIYDTARAKAFELCPAWVGPRLAQQYDDQPFDEVLRIGMKQLRGGLGDLEVFILSRRKNDGLQLSAGYAPSHSVVSPDDLWVFAKEVI